LELKYFIEDQEVHPPENEEELAIEINNDPNAQRDGEPVQAVSLNDFTWLRGDILDPMDGAKIINDYLKAGLTTGVGVGEGLPLTIRVSENGQIFNFEKYINAATATYDCDRVITTTVDRHKIDWLNGRIDSIRYELMFRNGEFTSADFIPMPYILSDLPDNREVLIAIISLFVIVNTLADQIEGTLEILEETPTGIGNAAAVVLKLLIRLIYISLLIKTIFNLIRHILNSLIQPVKFVNGMKLQRLCEIGAEHFGYTFESPILDNDPWDRAVIFPTKYEQEITTKTFGLFGGMLGMISAPVVANTYGFLAVNNPQAAGFYNGTPGDIFRACETMFKGKFVVDGTVLRFVRKDTNNGSPSYVVPAVDDKDFTLNWDELKGQYSVRFVTDINEKNTLQNYEGTESQAITTQSAIKNPDLSMIEGAEENIIPFARITAKTKLTGPEQAIEQLLNLVSILARIPVTILSALVLPFGFGAPSERIGMLSMENDYINVPKIGLIDVNQVPFKTKVSADNRDIVNSLHLWTDFHKPVVSFVPSPGKPNANQYKRFDIETIPQFCFADFVKLVGNDMTQDSKGKDAEVMSARWLVKAQKLELFYKINELYTNKLQEEVITPSVR